MRSKIFKICLLGILMMCGFAVQVSAIQIRGFGKWPGDGNSSNVTVLVDETNHLRVTVSNATVRANNSFKINDNGWYAAASGENTFNLSGNNISDSKKLSGNGADMTITTPGDGTFDYMIDVVKDNGEYTVTITRIPQVRGFGDSNWSSDQANLQYNSSNGHWTGSITKSQMQPANTINFKLFDGLWRGLPKASNGPFDIRQVNNNYTSNKTNIIDEGENLYIWAPTWDTGDKKYYFDIFWESTGYNVTIKRIPNKVYIGGSIAADPETTQVTNNNQTWDQHNSDTYPNLVLTDSGDGEYYIDFTPEALANSNRNAILTNGTGMDFRFVEVEQEEGGAVYNVYPSSSPKELSSNYNDTPLNHEGSPGNNYISVTPENGTVLYRIWFKNDNGYRSAKVEKGQAEFYIYGSMSDDPETTSGDTWGGGMNANRKLTDSGNGEYYIDFNATAFANSKRGAPYIGLDFRFIESISVSKFNNYPHLFPQPGEGNTATALPLTSSYQNIISGSNSDHHDSYMGVAAVDGATNYRVYLKRTEGNNGPIYQAKVDVTAPYAKLRVTEGSVIDGVPTANGYTFTIPKTGNYSLNNTLTFKVEINDGTTSQYIPATTIGTKDTDYSYTLANTAGYVTYGVPADADDEIIVTVNTSTNKISLTHGSIGHAGTTEQYYVVGTWFDTGFDNTDYNEYRFQMKKNPNGTFYFDIPANMQLNCQILSSTGTLYYPTGDANYGIDCAWPNSNGEHSVASAAKPASETTGIKWYFNGVQGEKRDFAQGVESISAGGSTYVDGSFRLTFNPSTAKWSVTYSTTRVSYLSSAANDWKVDFLYDKSRDHRHFGSSYIDTNGFKIINAWSYHNQDPSFYPLTKLKEKGNDGENGLLGGSHLNLTPMAGNNYNGHVIPMSAKGLFLVEDDPTRGAEVYTGENAWDNLLLFNSSGGTDPNPVFQTISLVGPAFPETMTGTDWDPAKGIDLYYDAEEQCFKTTVTTSQAAGQLFRFVADHTITTNWGEESTADEDKARVPYDGSGTGHAATDADPNDVKITKDATASNRNGSGNYGDIIFNRPAGNWVIRFYLRTPDTKVTSFYYTITESTEPDITLTPQSGIYESAVLTPTTVGADTHYTMTVNVQVVNAPKYKYTIGQDVSLDNAGVPVVTYNSANPFGTFRYNGDAENPRVWFKPYGGSEAELSTSSSPATLEKNGSQAKVYVNVVAADAGDNSRSAERTYVYTFAPSAALEAITGGSFINKTIVNVVGGKGSLYYTTGGDDITDPSKRLAVPANRQVLVSRPGTMSVTDGFTTKTANFDFTYSTSENYTNFWHNTPGEVVYAGGGKDATSVFIEVEDNMPMRIYAWNYSKDQMLIKQQEKKKEGYSKTAEGFNERDPQVKLTSYYPGTVLDDSRLLTIGGQKFFYLVVPKEKLKYTNEDNEVVYGEMAIILSKATRASSTLDADHYKTPNTIVDANSTFEYFSSPNTMSGNNVSTYNSYLAMPVNDDLTKIYGDNVVFCEVPSDWNSLYCYAWKDDVNNGWPGVRMSHVKTLENGKKVFAGQLTSRVAKEGFNLIFDVDGNSTDNDRYTGNTFIPRCYYDGNSSNKGSLVTNSEVTSTISDWESRKYSEMEDFSIFPNGAEYHEMRPDDKTYMLDPTWGGVISKPTDILNEEWSITHWSGYPVANETKEGGFRKRITNTMNLTQTVLHLDKGKEYTVQALVRAEGENGTKVRLTLNGASEVSDERTARNAGGGGDVGSGIEGSFVTKTGRVEYLTPTEFTKMNKQDGIGWFKLQAKAYPDAATGNLQITISTPNGAYFDLADVVLLEDADRPDGTTYRTTATKITSPVTYGTGTLNMDTYADYRDWESTASSQKNNAFSFFDRGENRNAVVFANEHTVLCLPGHEHPYNVVKTTSATDQAGVCPVLYLTDMGIPDVQSTNSAEYKGSGYTFKPVIPFNATDVVYDRKYNLAKSTMILPFTLTQAQLKAAYGDNVKAYTFSHYDGSEAVKRVVFDELQSESDLTANTPFILYNASGSLDSRSDSQATAKGDAVMSIPAINTNTYTANIDDGAEGGFTGRYDYTHLNTNGSENNKPVTYYGYNAQNGQFQIVHKTLGTNVKPFRAIFSVPNDGGSIPASAIQISFVDPQVTGITTVEEASQKAGYIYNVNGMLVRRDSRTESLPKGIYILNGRKFVVK